MSAPSSAQAQYGQFQMPTPKPDKAVTTAVVGKQPTPSASTLPFTGVDLGLSLAVGVGLVLMGLGIRRIASRKNVR